MNKTISALAALALLVAVGAAYALWADVLKVKVEVNTDDVDINLTGTPTANELHYDPSKVPPLQQGEKFGKDVAQCNVEIREEQDEEAFASGAGLLPADWNSGSANSDAELVINITNAYPSYICKVNGVRVLNLGSVPVKILVKLVNTTGDPIECTAGGYFGTICDVDGDGEYEIDVDTSSFFSLNGTQLHMGESQDFSVFVHVLQDADENTKYVFEVVIIGMQWNEWPGT